MLQGLAGDCKSPISRRLSMLRIAACCTVLRSRWCQSGVSRLWTRPRQVLCRPRTPLKAEPTRAVSKRLSRLPFACLTTDRLSDGLLAALLAPRIEIVPRIQAATSTSRAPESLPSVRTATNKRRCYLHEHLLIRARCFGATAWSRRARTPLVRLVPRQTPATPRTRRRCPGAGHRRQPKRSSRRLHDGGGFEEQKP